MTFLHIEIGKTIQKHILACRIAGFFQIVTQLGHSVPGIKTGPMQPRFIGTVQQRKVMYFLPCGAFYLRRRFCQTGRRYFVNAQFIEQIQHLLQKRCLSGWALVYRQFRCYFAQSLLQRQQLTAAIQRHLRKTPGNTQHPVTETAEAQHFRMAADRRPAEPAKVHLNQMGCMLRHQQNLTAAVTQSRDFPQDPIRFSRLGTANQQLQHGNLFLRSAATLICFR